MKRQRSGGDGGRSDLDTANLELLYMIKVASQITEEKKGFWMNAAGTTG